MSLDRMSPISWDRSINDLLGPHIGDCRRRARYVDVVPLSGSSGTFVAVAVAVAVAAGSVLFVRERLSGWGWLRVGFSSW